VECGPKPIAPVPKEPREDQSSSPEHARVLIVAMTFVVFLGLFFGAKALWRQSSTPERPEAVIETSLGSIRLSLYVDKSPKTVANFVKLAKSGFYDGIIFHRVIPGFMIQTGCPLGTGSGGPGYSFADEIHPDLVHDRPGLLSMANSGPNTNGSQFFITVGAPRHLDGKHAIFGEVIEGLEVCKKIAYLPRNSRDKPRNPAAMTKVTIEEAKSN
jgi:cyclophilin family peptidyl-prolyl cis-trans isomerase